MHTVFVNTEGTDSSYNQFEKEFLNICNQHRDEDRALVFAFILYNFENPQISKILNDADYWLSLNEISGHYLTVFSLHYKPEDTKARLMELMKAKMNSGTSKEMHTIPTFQNPSSETNKLIKKYFGDNIKVKYPSVLFFQTNKETISNHRLIQLDENQLESSFLELKEYIKVAAEALLLVNRDNKYNTNELFDLVDSSVRATRQFIQIRKGIKAVTSVAELASTVVGLKP